MGVAQPRSDRACPQWSVRPSEAYFRSHPGVLDRGKANRKAGRPKEGKIGAPSSTMTRLYTEAGPTAYRKRVIFSRRPCAWMRPGGEATGGLRMAPCRRLTRRSGAVPTSENCPSETVRKGIQALLRASISEMYGDNMERKATLRRPQGYALRACPVLFGQSLHALG